MDKYRFIVKIRRYDDFDEWDDEYSGIFHESYEDARKELEEARLYFPGCAHISTEIIFVEEEEA